MKKNILFANIVIILAISNCYAQIGNSNVTDNLDAINKQVSRISRSLDDLNKRLANFSETFNSNQGLRLTDKQQKLLLAFEVLNRAESRVSTLTLLKIQLVEKENATRKRISQIDESLRQENLDRSLSGTTDAESVRDNRRQALNSEKNSLTNLLSEIRDSIEEITTEIRQTELFIRSLRQKLFPEIDKELIDL
jgi:uncharacterized protein YukE